MMQTAKDGACTVADSICMQLLSCTTQVLRVSSLVKNLGVSFSLPRNQDQNARFSSPVPASETEEIVNEISLNPFESNIVPNPTVLPPGSGSAAQGFHRPNKRCRTLPPATGKPLEFCDVEIKSEIKTETRDVPLIMHQVSASLNTIGPYHNIS